MQSSKFRIDLVAIGKIVALFGIRGELKIAPMTYSVDRFTPDLTVRIGLDETTERQQTIRNVRRKGSDLIIHFDGIDDRNEAGKYVGQYLFVDKKQRMDLPPRTWFISDIIGFTVTDEEGTTIGILADVLRLPAQHVYVIRRGKREILIPAVPDVVKSVDLERRLMVVHMLDGLLDI